MLQSLLDLLLSGVLVIAAGGFVRSCRWWAPTLVLSQLITPYLRHASSKQKLRLEARTGPHSAKSRSIRDQSTHPVGAFPQGFIETE